MSTSNNLMSVSNNLKFRELIIDSYNNNNIITLLTVSLLKYIVNFVIFEQVLQNVNLYNLKLCKHNSYCGF